MQNDQLPSTRCTPLFRKAVEAVARKHNQTLADFTRSTLLKAIEDEFGDNWRAVVEWKPESSFLLEAR